MESVRVLKRDETLFDNIRATKIPFPEIWKLFEIMVKRSGHLFCGKALCTVTDRKSDEFS